jgi:hypothetical protein
MPFWLLERLAKQATAAPPVAAREWALERCNDTHQWARVEDVVYTALGSAEFARRLQVAASTQLDAADYALGRLLTELSTVMALPAPEHTAEIRQLEIPTRAAFTVKARKKSAAA